MKLRESGMPDEAYWESLFDVPLILDRLGIGPAVGDVVEMGCGYGTFTIPVARRIAGVIDTFDIEQEMVARTRERAAEAGLSNVRCHLRDVVRDGFGRTSASVDACLLFNILHGEEPLVLLGEAWRVVRDGGIVAVMHWRHDPSTPRGPSMDIRPRPEQCVGWAEQAGFSLLPPGIVNLPPYHYGLVFRRPAGENQAG